MSVRREILSYLGVGLVGVIVGFYAGAKELLGIQGTEGSEPSDPPTEASTDTPTETLTDEPTETPTPSEALVFSEDFDRYTVGESIAGKDGWIAQELVIEESAFGDGKAAAAPDHNNGVAGNNDRLEPLQYPDVGFRFRATVNVDTDEALPKVGISTRTRQQIEADQGGEKATIHFDSSNDGVGGDDVINFSFFGEQTVINGTPTKGAYQAEIIGYPDQTGVGRYRQVAPPDEASEEWESAQLSTSFEGGLHTVRFNCWKWGGQVDQLHVHQIEDDE